MARRNASSDERPKRSLAPAWAIAILAIVAPQILGGATPPTQLAILILASVACVWTLSGVRRGRRSLGAVPFAALGGFVAIGWTLMQLLPIPCSWVETAQPLRVLVENEAVEMGVLEAAQCTLTRAPGSTRASLALAATLTAVLLASVALSRAGYRDMLARSVAVSSVVMALVAITHTVLRMDRVFDWYVPVQARPPILLSPLLNPNHLAGHLALGFPPCLALGLRAKRLDARIAWLGLAFIVLTAGLLTLSRGGIAALFVGGAGYLVLHLMRGPIGDEGAPRRLVIALGSVVALVALAGFFAADVVAEELNKGDLTNKVASIREFLPLIGRHPLVGVGRGALVDASIGVTTGDARAHFAEDLPIHWAVEWGLPATALILTLVLASFAGVRPRRTLEWAVLCGLVALCAQNLVDFSLELAGVGCVAAIAFGSLLSREPSQPWMPWLPRPQLRASYLASTGLALASLALAVTPLSTKSRAALRDKLESAIDTDPERFQATLGDALNLYPLEPNFLILGAAQAVRANSRFGLRWLNLTMETISSWAGPHLQAAYYLETHGKLSQAALEIRFGFERNVGQAWASAHGFLKRNPRASYAREMLPESSDERQWIAESIASALFQFGTQEENETFLAEVLDAFPTSAPLNMLGVELAIRMDNHELALARAANMRKVCPDSPLGVTELIKAWVHAGSPQQGLLAYDSAPPQMRTDREVLLEALVAAGASANVTQANLLAEELFARYGGDAASRAGLHFHASVQFEAAGDTGQALSHAQRAYDLTGSPDVLERVHAIARRAGIMQVAVRAATELCHVGRRREVYCQHLSSP
jgi:hypothetical protein